MIQRGKIEIRPANSFASESAVDLERTEENKNDFIAETCRYMPWTGNSKKNKYVIQTKYFGTGTTENALC